MYRFLSKFSQVFPNTPIEFPKFPDFLFHRFQATPERGLIENHIRIAPRDENFGANSGVSGCESRRMLSLLQVFIKDVVVLIGFIGFKWIYIRIYRLIN